MATFNFNTTSTTFDVIRGGTNYGTWTRTDEIDSAFSIETLDATANLTLNNPYFSDVLRSSDTIQVNSVELTGSFKSKMAQLKDNVFFLPATGLPTVSVGADLVGFGDSITSNFYTNITVSSARGFIGWANFHAGSPFTFPIGFNKGVSGETTAQMLARIGAAVKVSSSTKGKVVTVLGGTNDINGVTTAATIISNLGKIYDTFLAEGYIVIAITILPRFDANALTTAQETSRQTVNSWIKTPYSSRLFVIDGDFMDATMFTDGLHPNTPGAFALGKKIATDAFYKIVLSTTKAAGILNISDTVNFVSNGKMTGTTGSLNGGATGQVATSYILQSVAGATVVGSKSAGDDKQIITISGNKTGTATMVCNYTTIPTTFPDAINKGDIFELLVDMEILTVPDGIAMAGYIETLFTTASGNVGNHRGMTHGENILTPHGVGRFTYRDIQIQISDSIPVTSVSVIVKFLGIDGSIPVSGQFKIHNIMLNRIYKQPIPSRTVRRVADVNATLGTSDYTLAYSSLTAARTVTLPATTYLVDGQPFVIKDESGSASGTLKLSIVGTIDGAVNPDAVTTAYGKYRFFYDKTANAFYTE